MSDLAADYEACAAVLAASNSSFSLPIRLLPREKRRGTTALYAFCRLADDIADGDGAAATRPEEAHERLDRFEAELSSALAGGVCREPVLRALADTAARYAIPTPTLVEVIRGVRQDLDTSRFETFDDLEVYCGRVASAVGLAAIHIWGFRDEAVTGPAHACGVAFQLTNILRDVTEDLARGRIYVPQEDFRAAGCDPEDLRAGRIGPEFAQLARLECRRAAGFYRQAAELDRMLSTDGRLVFRAMYGVYSAIFKGVREAAAGIFQRRPCSSRLRLAASAAVAAVAGPRPVGDSPATQGSAGESGRLSPSPNPPVVVVGGGLAGLAAAEALLRAGIVARGGRLLLFESRRGVGGRAASFEDRHGGGLVDNCQHVAMGCCTNFLDLCRRGGIEAGFRRDRTLWFIGPDGRRSGCTPAAWLPAPLHLLPLIGRMPHFSLREKLALALGMLRLARLRDAPRHDETAADWLSGIGQPPRVVELFWQPVLESALGESIGRVSVAAARKVLVDGFLAHRRAADLHVPRRPLGELFGDGLASRLVAAGLELKTGSAVIGVERGEAGGLHVMVERRGGGRDAVPCTACILATPWRAAARLVPDLVPDVAEQLAGSPITAVHLWFDRQVIDLPHAVLLGRLSQWVFRPEEQPTAHAAPRSEGYCQVVISGSHEVVESDREAVLARVVAELAEVFPAVREAKLLESRIVTDPTAVLSVRPGVERLRPPAATPCPDLFLAGDWTATGWPSTMEGAVRSGRLAAAACLERLGLPVIGPTPELPIEPLARLLVGGTRQSR